MIKPITPDDVVSAKALAIPDAVFDAFNEWIAAAWDGNQAVVLQHNILSRIAEMTGISQSDVINNHWLDVEEVYREAGWDVVYDKPGFNESSRARFIFTPRGKR